LFDENPNVQRDLMVQAEEELKRQLPDYLLNTQSSYDSML
jgi:hypothetical protein